MITIERPGMLALLQDLGRPGLAHLGVAPSGAWDRDAHTRANALVGNLASAATIELLHGGLELRTRHLAFVALVGPGVRLWVDGLQLALERPHALVPGARLTVETRGAEESENRTAGFRSYLAVAGGFDVPSTFGSRSRDTLAQLGPRPLSGGDELAVGRFDTGRSLPGHVPGGRSSAGQPSDDQSQFSRAFEVLPSPVADHAPAEVLSAVASQTWRVSSSSDRIAVRLLGDPVEHRRPEVAVQPLVPGAIQLPPSGQPIIFGPDHPLTGGYPVIGVLTQASLARFAQSRPGDQVALSWSSPKGSAPQI